MRLRLAGWLVLVLVSLLSHPNPARGFERTLDGGAHIWVGQQWGSFRAHVGPRWSWGWVSAHPNAAIGVAILPSVNATPLSLGGYLDLDTTLLWRGGRTWLLGVGGGMSFVPGFGSKAAVPQAYVQTAYRWQGNLVGLMAIGGPIRDWGIGTVSRIQWNGIGLRFEYEIERADETGSAD